MIRTAGKRPGLIPKLKRLMVLGCLTVSLAGCERSLRVTMDGKIPPTFTFDGSGVIEWVAIFEVTPDGMVPPKGSAFWKILPSSRVVASKSPPITYGVVPNGFYQTVPSGGSPPPLAEGKTYGFGAVTSGAQGGDVWFTIRDGKAVRVRKTDPADPERP